MVPPLVSVAVMEWLPVESADVKLKVQAPLPFAAAVPSAVPLPSR